MPKAAGTRGLAARTTPSMHIITQKAIDGRRLSMFAATPPPMDRLPATDTSLLTSPCLSFPAVMTLAAINPLADFLRGQADYFATLDLPQWLIKWVRCWAASVAAAVLTWHCSASRAV